MPIRQVWRVALAALLTIAVTATHAADDTRRSGFEFMSPVTQALQRDDGANPGMLNVAEGEALWQRRTGAADKSCADCHGDARERMRGVAARYPAWDAGTRAPIDLGGRSRQCQEGQQLAAPSAYESDTLLALLGLGLYFLLRDNLLTAVHAGSLV